MQGQEALFSENMPLKEIIFHLTNQLSTGGVNMRTPSRTMQDTSLETGQSEWAESRSQRVAHVGSFLGATSLSHFFAPYRK